MNKIFTVIIHKKEFDVYSIDNKEHEGLNGEPKHWWVYFSSRLPDGVLPPIDSPHWEPWSISLQRHCWDIRIKQYNSSKEKWGSTSFRSGTTVEMYCNDKLYYSFRTTGHDRGIQFAMAKVQYLQVALAEHPFNFYEPEKEIGRKIYWFGMPATIDLMSLDEPWEIKIIPDYTAGIEKEEWWKLYKSRRNPVIQTSDSKENDEMIFAEDDNEQSYIRWGDAFSDQYINWFRK